MLNGTSPWYPSHEYVGVGALCLLAFWGCQYLIRSCMHRAYMQMRYDYERVPLSPLPYYRCRGVS